MPDRDDALLARREELTTRVATELDRAYAKHGREQWGRHEWYAILLEEVEEAWDAIKRDLPQHEVEKELVQVAAMCFRYYETQDRYREPLRAVRAHEPGEGERLREAAIAACVVLEGTGDGLRNKAHDEDADGNPGEATSCFAWAATLDEARLGLRAALAPLRAER